MTNEELGALIRKHIRRVLEADQQEAAAWRERAEELEREGRRLVDGGPDTDGSWRVTDYRTGEVLASGDDGFDGYYAASDRLDPEDRWYHVDHIREDDEVVDVSTPGIPASLGAALEEWVNSSASDADRAAVLGEEADTAQG